MDLMTWIVDERKIAADLVDSLDADQLAAPSLCDRWTVRDVAAHLLMPLVTPMPRVLLAVAASGFNFDRANVRLTAEVARRSPAEIAAGLRERAGTRFKPPGRGFEAPLNDLLVHRQDIRRPLGLGTDLAPERVRVCLDYLAPLRLERAPSGPAEGSPLGGVRYQADDLDWNWGSGPEVRGTGEALLMVLNRRWSVLADVDGPGAALLRGRAPA
jgi:uncharacterized protein (TIGR03083 family)